MPKVGYVYLMQDGFNQHKIGITTRSVEQRLKELNGKQASSPIELVGYIEVSDVHGVEKILHEKFADYRTHGEWFNFRGNLDDVERMYNWLESQYPAKRNTQSDDWGIDWDALDLVDDNRLDDLDPWGEPTDPSDHPIPIFGVIGFFVVAILLMHLSFGAKPSLRTTMKANIRESANGRVVCEVPANAELPLIERGEWSEVKACGKTGFIHKSVTQ